MLTKDDFEILVFNSHDDFFNTLLALEKGTPIHSLLTDNPDFVSFWDTYQLITSLEKKDEIDELINKFPDVVRISSNNERPSEFNLSIRDELLAKLLNPRGYIIIGDKIIKAGGVNIKVITNGDKKLISTLEVATVSDPANFIEIHKIETIENSSMENINNKQQKVRAMYKWDGYEYVGNYTRCYWEKWIDFEPVFSYAYVGAKVTNEEKKWLGWLGWYPTQMELHFKSDYIMSWPNTYGGQYIWSIPNEYGRL